MKGHMGVPRTVLHIKVMDRLESIGQSYLSSMDMGCPIEDRGL